MKIPIFSKKTMVIIGVILVVVVIGTIWTLSTRDSGIKTTTTEGTAVMGNIDVFIEADGIVSAEKINVNFSQAGTLHNINVKVGDTVSDGDILATVDSSKSQYQVDQAKAAYDINVTKANRLKPGTGEEIIVKEVAVNAARLALTSEINIYNDVVTKYGIGSTQELAENAKLKKAESDLSSAEAQLSLTSATYNDARYAVSSSFASLESARLALSEANLTSPINGVITGVNGVIGQPTGGTQQTTTGLISISKLDNLTIISNLDEEDISKVKVGQEVSAEFTSISKTVKGKVSYVSPVAKTDSNGLVTYEVKISFVADGGKIIDGMNASIQFITKSVQSVVKIPNKAVKLTNSKSTISYYDSSKNLLTKEITTGFTDGQNVEVVTGLSAGDKYVVVETK
jgi:macrolide-specific efflux system membrane fusion protein